jgi:hypothetical protein
MKNRGNEPPRGKRGPPVRRGIWNVRQFPNRRLVREEIADLWSDYTVWFNTNFLKVLRYLNRGKPEPKVRRTFGSRVLNQTSE